MIRLSLWQRKNDKSYRRKVKEEHISITSEPNSNYAGHIIPQEGTAKGISNSIGVGFSILKMFHWSAIGCDVTATNIGSKNGIIKIIE